MHTAKIIALSLGLGITFSIVMALVSRLFVHRHSQSSKQDICSVDGHHGKSPQISLAPRRSSSWKQLFAPKLNDHDSRHVPTFSVFLKAGDEVVWSALFTNPHGHPGDVSFGVICEMLANELRPRPMARRSAYSGEIGNFVKSAKRSATSPKRVQSVSYKRMKSGRGDVAPTTRRVSLDISTIERGLGRSLSIKRPTPPLVATSTGLFDDYTTSDAQRTWMEDGVPAEYYNGQLSVKISPAELAALSVLLGSSITRVSSSTNATPIDKGAFGIAIQSIMTDDGRNIVCLKRQKRSLSRTLSTGSGHSLLFAKHLACGSLPFAQDARSISSLLMIDEVLDAVRSGTPITMRKSSQHTSSSKFLAQLPNLGDLVIYAIETSTKSSPATPLFDAIAMLPFVGGLTPLASRPLCETVRFVASGGLDPGRLLQRLEGLIDKVQRPSPHLDIFGPLYEPQNAGLLFRERERLAKVASGAVSEELADKVARVYRYVTLLQRLMALVPDMKPQQVLAAVKEATKKDLARSYADAVAAHKAASTSPHPFPTVNDTNCPPSDARSNRRHASNASRPSARLSPRSSLGSGVASSRLSMSFPEHNLGKQVEVLLKSELPFSVDTIATVSRLVIVAWTLSVGIVAWKEGEEGFRVPEIKKLPEEMLFI